LCRNQVVRRRVSDPPPFVGRLFHFRRLRCRKCDGGLGMNHGLFFAGCRSHSSTCASPNGGSNQGAFPTASQSTDQGPSRCAPPILVALLLVWLLPLARKALVESAVSFPLISTEVSRMLTSPGSCSRPLVFT